MDGSVDGRNETILFRNAYKTSQVILTQGRFYQFFTNIINFNLQLGYHTVILKAILLLFKEIKLLKWSLCRSMFLLGKISSLCTSENKYFNLKINANSQNPLHKHEINVQFFVSYCLLLFRIWTLPNQ